MFSVWRPNPTGGCYKYHVIFVPKYRRKTMFLELRQYLGPMFHALAR